MILVDTNLLTRLTTTTTQHGLIARAAVRRIREGREKAVIVPQNLYEFWAVATRIPGSRPTGENGLGFSTVRAGQWLSLFRRHFHLIPDREDLLENWQRLVAAHNIRGFRSHDARLVAAMQSHGIDRLMTFNVADFKPFGITVIDPEIF